MDSYFKYIIKNRLSTLINLYLCWKALFSLIYNKTLSTNSNKMLCKKYVPFRIQFDSQQRKRKSKKFLQDNIDRVPLIVEPLSDSKISPLQNGKFAVDRQKTVTYLKSIFLIKMKSDSNGLFLFLGKKLLHEGQTKLGDIYDRYHDPDGFLYLQYSQTNPF